MTTVSIYALDDPQTGLVGYVGRSAAPESRFRQHCKEPGGIGAPGDTGSFKHQWLRRIRAAGREPRLIILTTTDAPNAKGLELEWIAYFRQLGEAAGNGHDRRRPAPYSIAARTKKATAKKKAKG